MNKNKKWIISQYWKDLLFLNFKVCKKELRSLVPAYLELDLFEGEAYTSVVPFVMNNVRFPYIPYIPFSKLNELNLRTYVTFNGIKGIYFFTLDSNHVLANFVAKIFFHLPYRNSNVFVQYKNESYLAKSENVLIEGKVGEQFKHTDFSQFITNRYSLFTNNSKHIFQGRVFHESWLLHELRELSIQEKLNSSFGLNEVTYVNGFYSSGFDVYFQPFNSLGIVPV